MNVVETFVSINGEGLQAGKLAAFIRFKGCNLNCSYCDTKWANEPDCAYSEMSPQEIYDYILSTGVRYVTLTGGEPLLQKEMPELLSLLCSDRTLSVEIETNGSVDLNPFATQNRPAFTMDYKLPSSGCEAAMKIGNLALLKECDVVKFVVGDRNDLDRAGQIIAQEALEECCQVFLSPVFGKIPLPEIVEYMKEKQWNNVRMQIQMHKIIWDPDKRGV